MKKAYVILLIIAVLLSDVMCALVAYSYRDIVCGMNHMGYSAPPSLAFVFGIPFLIAIACCVAAAVIIRKKSGGKK